MFKVVDLFAGPGGLAEGFASVRGAKHRRIFDISLSVEKEASAFATLRLRAFVRQFEKPPPEYYEYVSGTLTHEALVDVYPTQWASACEETLQLELGTPQAIARIDPLIDAIAGANPDKCILVGGPPCQAYSLMGRARNSGTVGYVAREDHRHFLYREYIRILGRLRPVAFVMENVKGFLSASIDGEAIYPKVVADLRHAGGLQDSYQIHPLVAGRGSGGAAHLLRAEEHGVPQRRHRVILLGIRHDIASMRSVFAAPGDHLAPRRKTPTVRDALAGMPPLRSRLSKVADSSTAWRNAATEAFRAAAEAAFTEEDEDLDRVVARLLAYAEELGSRNELPPVSSSGLAGVCGRELSDWLVDPALSYLPNHDTRGHMESDLARYAFASTFCELRGRSPKAAEFPAGLAPSHSNWASGKFNDRFRVQGWDQPASTVTSHIAKDGHYYIHPDPTQCRSLTVREAARLQTFPDNYFFEGNRTQQYTQVGNAVPPLLANHIAEVVKAILQK